MNQRFEQYPEIREDALPAVLLRELRAVIVRLRERRPSTKDSMLAVERTSWPGPGAEMPDGPWRCEVDGVRVVCPPPRQVILEGTVGVATGDRS